MLATNSPATPCANNPGTDGTVYDSTSISTRPVLREFPALTFPTHYLRPGETTSVSLSFVVQATGAVDSGSVVVVASGDTRFNEFARAAVLGSTYWPGCRELIAVHSRIERSFTFGLSRVPVDRVRRGP